MRIKDSIPALIILAFVATYSFKYVYNDVDYNSPSNLQKLQTFITDKTSSHNYNENMELAAIAFNTENYERAIQLYTYALKQRQNSGEAYYYRAQAKLKMDYFQSSKEDLDTALKLNPSIKVDNQFRKDLLSAQLEDAKLLLEKRGTFYNFDPDDYAIGDDGLSSDFFNRLYGKGLEELDEVIKYQPNNYEAYIYRGIAKTKLARFEDAVKDFDYSLRIKPNNPDVYFNVGNLCLDRIDYQEYQENNHTGPIKYQVNFEEINNRTNEINSNTNEKEDLSVKYKKDYLYALKSYNVAIALDHNFEEAYYNRGLTKWMLKDYAGAIQDFSTVIRLNPSNKDAYQNRADIKSEYLSKYKNNISSGVFNQIRSEIVLDYAFANDLTPKEAEQEIHKKELSELFETSAKH